MNIASMQTLQGKQAIYNHVRQHLLTQKKKAADITGACYYRAPDGSKCAAGCLIPDELYKPEMENRTFNCAFGRFDEVIKFHGLSEAEVDFVYELQCVHDKRRVEEWEVALDEIAVFNELEIIV